MMAVEPLQFSRTSQGTRDDPSSIALSGDGSEAYTTCRGGTAVSKAVMPGCGKHMAQQVSICAAKASESRCVQCAGNEVAEFHYWRPERTRALIWGIERSRSCRIVAASPTRHEVCGGLRRLK